ncbi:MAG: flagellar hook capping FlgD N-terminal domain-containing protein [Nitrospirales bacterium]
MDPITPTASNSTVTGQGHVQAAVSELGSDVFLRLLVTQLQSQDPTNPVHNEDFIAQLAQFTTLEQATNTNDLLGDLIAQDTQRTQLGLVNLIGRTVISQGDSVSVGKEDQPILAYALSGDASAVTIDILGKDGQIIRKIESNVLQHAGANKVQWDGLDAKGDRVPEGVYQFRAKAEDLKKNVVPVLTFGREPVANIAFGADTPVVLQSGKTLKTQDIISIQ